MTYNTTTLDGGALGVDRHTFLWKTTALFIAITILVASSYIEVPMYPVPMTMQTAAVLLIGALYGRKFGSITVGSWLALAALGAPFLSGGTGGFHKFAGPTAGYIYGFFIAAYFVGWLSDKGWNGKRPLLAFFSMFVGGMIILGLGFLWLGILIGFEKAFTLGVAPFLLGDIVKTVLAVLVLMGTHKIVKLKLDT